MGKQLIILEGSPSTGKTTAIEAVYSHFKGIGYSTQDYFQHPNPPDFQSVVVKNNKCIIIHSYTDTLHIIDEFDDYCKKHLPNYQNFDIMILVPCRTESNPKLKAKTIGVCHSISNQITILKPTGQYFNYQDVLAHLFNCGF